MLARFGSVFDEYPFPPQVGLIGPGHAMVRLNLVSGRKEVTEGSQGRFCGGQNHLARHIPHRSPLMVSKQEEGTTVIGGKHSWGLRWCRVKLGVWVPRTATYIIVIVHSVASDSATPWTAAHQVSLSFLPPGACLNSCPLSWWCHPSISSSAVPFSSCFQFFQHQGLFQWIGSSHQVVKVLELQLLINIHNSFPLGLTGLISYSTYCHPIYQDLTPCLSGFWH